MVFRTVIGIAQLDLDPTLRIFKSYFQFKNAMERYDYDPYCPIIFQGSYRPRFKL